MKDEKLNELETWAREEVGNFHRASMGGLTVNPRLPSVEAAYNLLGLIKTYRAAIAHNEMLLARLKKAEQSRHDLNDPMQPCPDCGGSGSPLSDPDERCDLCRGTGVYPQNASWSGQHRVTRAFPASGKKWNGMTCSYVPNNSEGMTLRQYAAIKLKVPDSGTDWLDDMIRQSLRDELAAKAMQGIIGGATGWSHCGYTPIDGLSPIENDARLAYQYADAMIKARGEA